MKKFKGKRKSESKMYLIREDTDKKSTGILTAKMDLTILFLKLSNSKMRKRRPKKATQVL